MNASSTDPFDPTTCTNSYQVFLVSSPKGFITADLAVTDDPLSAAHFIWAKDAWEFVESYEKTAEGKQVSCKLTPFEISCSPLVENKPEKPCTHGVYYDRLKAQGMSSEEIQDAYPRLRGECPLGCGFNGIAYASSEHYVMGDW